MFRPILKRALEYFPTVGGRGTGRYAVAQDGRSIPQALYQRDPLSPPFHINLVLGLRFLQVSLLAPLHRNSACRRARFAHSL